MLGIVNPKITGVDDQSAVAVWLIISGRSFIQKLEVASFRIDEQQRKT